MGNRIESRPQAARLLPVMLGLSGLLTACGSGSSSDAFNLRTGTFSASPTAGIVVGGSWAVYFADEATEGPGGTDLNGDGDLVDEVAVAVKTDKKNREFLTLAQDGLGVAAVTAAANSGEIYLLVDESEDGRDWNMMNGLNDFVLLHWSDDDQVVTFVDTLNPNIVNLGSVTVDRRVYYSADAVPVGDETTIRYLTSGDPLTPVVVENTMGAGPLSPLIQGEEEDLIFLSIDEVVEGVDQNGDGDANDNFVLALLDGRKKDRRIANVGLAQASILAPFDAKRKEDDDKDWLVGFLVNEADQGDTNLNDQALFMFPLLTPACAGTPDMDTNDDVLHFIQFKDFVAGTSGPVNTGLAGRDRVIVVKDYVAALSLESDANCDLNEDGDLLDVVPRWVEAVTPIMPPNDPAQFHAVGQTIPGGSLGISRLDKSFVIIVDEAADSSDLDGKPQDHCLVGWLKPREGFTTLWTFAHQSSSSPAIGTAIFEDTDGDGVTNPDNGASEPYGGPSYMAEEDRNGRLGVTFLEEVPGTNPRVASINNNLKCRVVIKDTDLVDAMPVWLDFEDGPILDWDGVGYSTDAANAGVFITGNHAFYRVDEAADNRDYNKDGVLDDIILFRNPLNSCNPKNMEESSFVPGPAIITDLLNAGAAFFVSEAMAGEDLNEDGDLSDLIVRYFGL
jgi:hypothetical protein